MATAVASEGGGWHAGERAIQHALLGDRDRPRDNPTFRGLAPSYGHRVQNAPLVAFGALDGAGRPWTTVWGGEAGFCRPVAQGVLGVRGAAVDARYDPVLGALFGEGGGGGGGGGGGEGGGRVLSGLSIDLETRDRVKLAGRLVAGAARRTAPDGALAHLQMAFRVTESLGNCPKYLNKKRIVPHVPRPRLLSQGPQHVPLPDEAIELVRKADLFFLSSKHGGSSSSSSSSEAAAESMDTNHRGGPAGFVRVLRNDAAAASSAEEEEGGGGGGGVALVYPEYSGNRLYQTLGNLQTDPAVGLAVPDLATGDVLYLTGRAAVLVGDRAAAYLPRCKLAVRIDVRAHRFVRDGLPFRGSVLDYSPYNPPVRRLVSEKAAPGASGGGASSTDEAAGLGTARLVAREEITPTIARYVFRLTLSRAPDHRAAAAAASAHPPPAPLWHPGQHVTLDFGPELDHGWSHMRDDDPQSLNDDFVRTFTISSSSIPPSSSSSSSPSDSGPLEFEITARRHGPATGLLARWNLRVPLALPVLGFGGEAAFRLPRRAPAAANHSDDDDDDDEKDPAGRRRTSVFVAGGVGITPLMAQARGVLPSLSSSLSDPAGGGGGGETTPLPLRVLWSLRGEDLALAVQVVERDPGLGREGATTLFVTGSAGGGGGGGGDNGGTKETAEQQQQKANMARLEDMGVVVKTGRMGRDDVLGAAAAAAGGGSQRRFFCCTGPELMKRLLQWTEGEDVVFESFQY